MKSLVFIIEGQVPSKKNQRRIFVKNGRVINIPSKKYQEWHDSAMTQIKALKVPRLEPCYEISLVFWFRDRRRKDLDNSQASVLDLLQDAEIIEDDDAKSLNKITASYGGVSKESPRVKVEIKSKLDKPKSLC